MSILLVWIYCSACGKRTTGGPDAVGQNTAPQCCGKGVWVLGKGDRP